MIKLYLFLFSFLGVIFNAQLYWKKLDPTVPPGFPYSPQYSVGAKDLIWVSFADGAAPFKVATGTSFSISTDGGNTWATKGYFPFNLVSNDPNGFTYRGFSSLSSNSALYLWAVNNSAKVFKTKDGGITWQKTGEFDTYPHSMYFFDANNGIVVCRESSSSKFKIYRTTDGGDSWQGINEGNVPPIIGTDTAILQWGFYAGYKDSFWFGTYNGKIFKTNDKGVTWTVVQSPYNSGAMTGTTSNSMGHFTLEDANTAYMVEYFSGKLHKTTDGGVTWTDLGKTETGTSDYNILKIPNSDVLLASGQITKYTLDKGLTWTKIDDDPKFDPTSTGANSTYGTMTTNKTNIYKLMGIVDKSPVETETPVGSKDDDVEFAIYPIPTGDYLYVRSKILIDGYVIWDSAGRLIQQGKTNDNRINVSWFSEGTYHIEIRHNGNTIVKKFIKE